MSLENSDEQNHDHLGPASSPERPHSTVTLYRKSNRTTDTLKFEPGARGIDGVAIAFALGAGGADTSHKPPSFKGVCPGTPAQEHRVQELILSMRMSDAQFEHALVSKGVRAETFSTPTEENSCKRSKSNAAPLPLAEFACSALRVSFALGLVDPPILRSLLTGHVADLRRHVLPDSGRA